MVFSKKWLRNHHKFLLHFLIHIDVLMLYRMFELIPTKNFGVMTIFINESFSEKDEFWPNFVKNENERIFIFIIFFMMLCRSTQNH